MGKPRLALKNFLYEQRVAQPVAKLVVRHFAAGLLVFVHSMPSGQQLEASFGPSAPRRGKKLVLLLGPIVLAGSWAYREDRQNFD